ncbi:MAG: hypothetical protein ABIC57_02775 [bacterium]
MSKKELQFDEALQYIGDLLGSDAEVSLDRKKREQYANDPIAFCHDVLGVKLWERQEEILLSIRDNERTTVRSCNSAGKSFVAACAVLWFLKCFESSTVVTTATTQRQVKDVLWREIAARYHSAREPIGGKMLTTYLNMSSKEKWFATGFTTRDQDLERFQGFHNESILVVVDEASGVGRSIFEAIEGLLASGITVRLLLIGNPLDEATVFGDSFKSSSYNRIHISAFDTPNVKMGRKVFPGLISQEWVDGRGQEWGENSPLYQIRVLGNFPDQSEDTLIAFSWIHGAIEADVLSSSMEKVIGMDIARFGSDETVAIYREGDEVKEIRSWKHKDVMESVGRLISFFDEINADYANIDEIGIGSGAVDRMKEQGYRVNGINFGASAIKKDTYLNLRAEAYWNLRKRFQERRISIPENDQNLINELSQLKYDFLSTGKIRIESKEDIKKRIGRSPDRADALALAFMDPMGQTESMGMIDDLFESGPKSEGVYKTGKIGYNIRGIVCPSCGKQTTARGGERFVCFQCGSVVDENRNVVGKKNLLDNVFEEVSNWRGFDGLFGNKNI